MADIFVSYAREDGNRVKAIAGTLTNMGWTVWRDDRIRGGAEFDLVIDQELDTASCVIVVWSSASVDSRWVRAEAESADEQGKLVPVTFEHELRLPVRFRQINTTFLTSTELSEQTPDVVGLLTDIAVRTGKRPNAIAWSLTDTANRERSSGARIVTSGQWRITMRVARMRAIYDLNLHPTGMVTGTGRWTISRAKLSGRWVFDPAAQILHLEMSGGIEKGTRAVPVRITKWTSADSADCRFERRRARLERVRPTATPGR